ncbi:MAG: hypothetical protein FJW90_02075 [Actinobacteria bacterium]|nr:hypothetical protein [Actinomycetota bacterium]
MHFAAHGDEPQPSPIRPALTWPRSDGSERRRRAQGEVLGEGRRGPERARAAAARQPLAEARPGGRVRRARARLGRRRARDPRAQPADGLRHRSPRAAAAGRLGAARGGRGRPRPGLARDRGAARRRSRPCEPLVALLETSHRK